MAKSASLKLNPLWISGNAWNDLLILSVPGIVALFLMPFIHQDGLSALVAALLISSFLDSGHVYTTFFRLWIYAKQSRHRLFLWIPVTIWIVFFSWPYFQVPYLWSFVLYATIFHNVRQFYGFLRWYEHLNKRSSRLTHVCFYLLLVLPVILYHFRMGVPRGTYSAKDLFEFPDMPRLRDSLIVLYSATWGIWLVHELHLGRLRKIEWNRISALLTPALIYGFCLLRGQTLQEVLYPLLVAHGVAYFFASVISLRRSPATAAWTLNKAVVLVVGTAIVFGSIEAVFEQNLFEDLVLYWVGPASILKSVILATYLTPVMSHYAYDMWLWKSRHPDFKKIVNTPHFA